MGSWIGLRVPRRMPVPSRFLSCSWTPASAGERHVDEAAIHPSNDVPNLPALPFTGLDALREQVKATTPILLACVIGAFE